MAFFSVAWIVIWSVLSFVGMIPVLGWRTLIIWPLLGLGGLILWIILLVKANQGQMWQVAARRRHGRKAGQRSIVAFEPVTLVSGG